MNAPCTGSAAEGTPYAYQVAGSGEYCASTMWEPFPPSTWERPVPGPASGEAPPRRRWHAQKRLPLCKQLRGRRGSRTAARPHAFRSNRGCRLRRASRLLVALRVASAYLRGRGDVRAARREPLWGGARLSPVSDALPTHSRTRYYQSRRLRGALVVSEALAGVADEPELFGASLHALRSFRHVSVAV